jgi:hypothetical protein
LADGFVCHPTTSHPVVLRAHTLPALAEGASRAVRDRPLAVIANPQPMMAPTREGVEALREARRSELAFLYSTPAYRRQLEYFGLGDVGQALSAMAKNGQWDDLAYHLTDDVMNHIVPQGTYDDIGDVLAEWYSGLCTGMTLHLPADERDDEQLARLIDRCHQIAACGVA